MGHSMYAFGLCRAVRQSCERVAFAVCGAGLPLAFIAQFDFYRSLGNQSLTLLVVFDGDCFDWLDLSDGHFWHSFFQKY